MVFNIINDDSHMLLEYISETIKTTYITEET